MFTGIIEGRSRIRSTEPLGEGGLRLRIPAPRVPAEPFRPALGDSIAISGACLTVAELAAGEDSEPELVFDLSRETLDRTWFGGVEPGRWVNLERAMRLGDRLDGHLVSGHVDGRGRIVAIEDSKDGGRVFTFEVEAGFERYLIEKGSVCVDGISLTVVEPEERRFRVAVIPLTLELTSLGVAREGDPVNLEADMVGKWIERLVPGGR